MLASPPDCHSGENAADGSRLSSIMLQYLRQQHKTACLSARQPVSTLPPLSLTSANPLPQVLTPTPSAQAFHKPLTQSVIITPMFIVDFALSILERLGNATEANHKPLASENA